MLVRFGAQICLQFYLTFSKTRVARAIEATFKINAVSMRPTGTAYFILLTFINVFANTLFKLITLWTETLVATRLVDTFP